MTTPINGKIFDHAQLMQDEIDYMTSRIKTLGEGSSIVEWGSGGSTELWLGSLPTGAGLISIEHNKTWYDRSSSLRDVYPTKKFSPIFVDVSSPYFEHGYGVIVEETPFNVAEYIYPTDDIYKADIYFIDGIARGACLAGILLHGKPSAEIYIHDYRDRIMAYGWITQFKTVTMVGTTLACIT